MERVDVFMKNMWLIIRRFDLHTSGDNVKTVYQRHIMRLTDETWMRSGVGCQDGVFAAAFGYADDTVCL